MKLKLFNLVYLFCGIFFAQNNINGVIKDANGYTVAGAKIQVEGGDPKGIYSDFTGSFVIKSQLPIVLKVSSYGYKDKTIEITQASEKIIIVLAEEVTALSTIVVSASRSAEKIIETPVTIERVDAKDIKKQTAVNFYDALENLKELHMNTGSYLQKTVNTRGFATAGNQRFLQLIDGMENTSPALNTVIGNLFGLNELDVDNIEILPGASSALYGANAFNGILFMNSKSAFTNPGVSAYIKQGFTKQKIAGSGSFYDFGARWAHKFSDKFAAKGNFSSFKGNDWQAADYRNVAATGRDLNPSQFYDGLNLYGDEIATTITPTIANPGTPNIGQVSRTPYEEKDLYNGNTYNYKYDVTLSYKPTGKDLQIDFVHKGGKFTTNYAATDARTLLRDVTLNQTKLEVKGKNFFVRGYQISQNSGDSFSMTRAAWNINEIAKSNTGWFTDFATAYGTAQAVFPTQTKENWLQIARNFADYNTTPAGFPVLTPNGNPRLVPGTADFQNAYNKVTNDANGAKFTDKSSFFHTEGNYNFRDQIKFAEIQIGGSRRSYNLDSNGTVYTDKNDVIKFSEFGVYSQIQKKFLNSRLKFTGSVRYDKSDNFDGNFSPRVSVSYALGKNLQRNLRASFQTGFRNPSTQDQYGGLNVGPITFIGSSKDNLIRFKEVVGAYTITGTQVYNNAYTISSIDAFRAKIATGDIPGAQAALVGVKTATVKPEQVKSYEIGYRADISKFNFDMNLYVNNYTDFITTKKVVVPFFGDVFNQGTLLNGPTGDAVDALAAGNAKAFQVTTNSTTPVNTFGLGFGVVRKFGKYDVGFNYNYASISYDANKDKDLQPGFNTPKNRFKASFGSEKLTERIGFNTNLRWNSAYEWQPAVVYTEVPANTVLDAQINYNITSWKTMLKVGANNLFGKDYTQVIGAANIGQQFYIGLTYNQ